MTDRELLEAAAKAAGIEIELRYEEPAQFRGLLLRSWKAPKAPAFWNPLTDDGDAFRLAVKLRIRISQCEYDGYEGMATDASWLMIPGVSTRTEFHKESDPYAATRRAIVRAAAEIGKTIP